VRHVERDGERYRLEVLRRDAKQAEVMLADLALGCSGFGPDLKQPLIRSLFEAGLARPDPHRRGIDVERNGNVIAKGEAPSPGLFAVGPLCLGTLWEITAVPEIVRQAEATAEAVAALQVPVRQGGVVTA
jgi:uncharacterized NAD(P)/FAD-binding protein YdhS